MSLESYLRAAPKAELHVHLEGSIQPATVIELARRNGITLPVADEAGLREWFAFRDFAHFVEVYLTISRCLRTIDDYILIVHEFGAELARQNCRYAEVTFSPSTHHWFEIPQDVWWQGLIAGRKQVRDEFGVELAWVFDIVRNNGLANGGEKADYTLQVAIEGMSDGVIALGLGGSEDVHPPEPFAPWFDKARAAGLRSTPHAGEHGGPASVWGAINELGAERLGHGVRSIEDPRLVELLIERQIPIETNPTSNVLLGVAPSLAGHQVPSLLAAGVPLTVNSDDPPLFNTTLTDEYLALAGPMGLPVEQIDEVLLNGIRHSFLPDARKASMEDQYRAELAELRKKHLL